MLYTPAPHALTSLWRWACFYLREHRLGLGQPESHLHRPVQLDGRRQGGTGLLPSSHLAVEPTQSMVAVGLERTHAELLGQGQGLLVVGFSLRDIGGIGVSIDDGKLVQCVGFVPTCLELSGQVECPECMLPGLLAVSRQTTDLTEPCIDRTSQPTRADIFPERLL